MVTVNSHFITLDRGDGHDLHAAIRAGGMELHAGLELVDALEHVATQHGNQLGAEFTIGVFRLNGNFQLVTRLLAFQFLLKTRDDVAGTLQVNQRTTTGGRIQYFAGIIGECVFNRYGFVRSNLHNSSPVFSLKTGQFTPFDGQTHGLTDARVA